MNCTEIVGNSSEASYFYSKTAYNCFKNKSWIWWSSLCKYENYNHWKAKLSFLAIFLILLTNSRPKENTQIFCLRNRLISRLSQFDIPRILFWKSASLSSMFQIPLIHEKRNRSRAWTLSLSHSKPFSWVFI